MSFRPNKKYQSKKHVHQRDKKRQDIEKSLTHRANIKRKYFKLLEKEGEAVPEKKSNKSEKKVTDISKDDDKKKFESETEEPKDRMMTYSERAQLVKERKKEQRKEAIDRIEAQRKQIEEEKANRAKIKKRLERKNKYGQPKMAPRINNLLDKIKKDMN